MFALVRQLNWPLGIFATISMWCNTMLTNRKLNRVLEPMSKCKYFNWFYTDDFYENLLEKQHGLLVKPFSSNSFDLFASSNKISLKMRATFDTIINAVSASTDLFRSTAIESVYFDIGLMWFRCCIWGYGQCLLFRRVFEANGLYPDEMQLYFPYSNLYIYNFQNALYFS